MSPELAKMIEEDDYDGIVLNGLVPELVGELDRKDAEIEELRQKLMNYTWDHLIADT